VNGGPAPCTRDRVSRAHGGRIGDISVYGQELNYATWRLCKMNLAIRGIDGQITHGDTFHNDRFPDLRADFILRGQVLFIDARKMGRMVDRVHRELTEEEIQKIANTCHAWRTIGPHPEALSPWERGKG
jgi:type I restriction-modification system DNA methylase subunit